MKHRISKFYLMHVNPPVFITDKRITTKFPRLLIAVGIRTSRIRSRQMPNWHDDLNTRDHGEGATATHLTFTVLIRCLGDLPCRETLFITRNVGLIIFCPASSKYSITIEPYFPSSNNVIQSHQISGKSPKWDESAPQTNRTVQDRPSGISVEASSWPLPIHAFCPRTISFRGSTSCRISSSASSPEWKQSTVAQCRISRLRAIKIRFWECLSDFASCW